MRAQAVAVTLAFVVVGTAVANATSACSFTSQGAGGDAAAPWTGDDGSFSFPNTGSSGGTGVGTNGSSGSGSGGLPSTGEDGGGLLGNVGDSGGSSACTAAVDFPQDCINYYGQFNNGGACSACASTTSCPPASATPGCSLTNCQNNCLGQFPGCSPGCASEQYCACISQCLQVQGQCCMGATDTFFICDTGDCAGPCNGGGGG